MTDEIQGRAPLYYGAAYYPEWVAAAEWEHDVRGMKQAGCNVVRIGEFCWAHLEPRQDEMDLSLLQAFIALCDREGMRVFLCTPTATPPVWLSYGHPERMFQEADGVPMSHGSRQQACTNNAFYRERSALITRALAEAFGGHPAVIAWQLDNELKSHVAECFCDTCRTGWQLWLQQRYLGQIGLLNEAWGTGVWSQVYQRFEQVPMPVKTPYLHSTSLATDFKRFSRETVMTFVQEQAAIIRACSNRPITHNTGLNHYLDNETLFAGLDFAGFDQYGDQTQFAKMRMAYDILRPMKAGRPYWVLETAPSHSGNTHGYHKLLPEGYMTALVVSAYASGAGGFMYWVWRQPRSGVEQPHGAVISAWGKKTVGYKPVADAGAARSRLEPLLQETTLVPPEAVMTYSDRARMYFLTEPMEGLDYREQLSVFYEALTDCGIAADLAPEEGELSGCRLLITPFLMHLSEAYKARALAHVRAGGIWIVGPLSGIRTAAHTMPVDAALGDLEKTGGVETVFQMPMTGSGTTGSAFGVTAPLVYWSSVFAAQEAEVLGTVHGGPGDSYAFLTERRIGAGKLVLLGAMPDGEAGREQLRRLLLHYAGEARLQARYAAAAGTAVYLRAAADGRQLQIAVNLDGEGGWSELPAEGIDALTGAVLPAGRLDLAPYEHRAVWLQDKGHSLTALRGFKR